MSPGWGVPWCSVLYYAGVIPLTWQRGVSKQTQFSKNHISLPTGIGWDWMGTTPKCRVIHTASYQDLGGWDIAQRHWKPIARKRNKKNSNTAREFGPHSNPMPPPFLVPCLRPVRHPSIRSHSYPTLPDFIQYCRKPGVGTAWL